MITKLEQTEKVVPLFAHWQDSCIWSCLQGVMGDIFVTDTEAPRSAAAVLGEYAFFAGEPDRELAGAAPCGGGVLIPLNEGWAKLIGEVYPNAERCVRYALRKDTRFDRERLGRLAAALPRGYELRSIDAGLCSKCFADPFAKEFVAPFGTEERFDRLGRGFVVLKEGRIVAGASSYSRYREGIEVQVVTAEDQRRRGLACAACARLILACLDEGLYPSWDAANLGSLRLAEKLGYEFACEYASFEI